MIEQLKVEQPEDNTPQQVSRSIKISVCGFSQKELARLSTIFSVVYKNRCKMAAVDHDADICIFNMDGCDIPQWMAYRQKFPYRPTIILSTQGVESDDAIVVQSPPKLGILWQAIEKCFSESQELNVIPLAQNQNHTIEEEEEQEKNNKVSTLQPGEGSPVDFTNNKKDTFYSPDAYLQGYVQKLIREAKTSQICFRVRCFDKQYIIIDGPNRCVYTNFSDQEIKKLGNYSRGEVVTEKVEVNRQFIDDLQRLGQGMRKLSDNALIWALALHTAHNRVPQGTDPEQFVFLYQWPNLTRFVQTPHAMRISSFLAKQPRSLSAIAKSLNIPQRDVFSFYSAAHAIGIAGQVIPTNNKPKKQPQTAQVDRKKHSLFSAMLRRFKSE